MRQIIAILFLASCFSSHVSGTTTEPTTTVSPDETNARGFLDEYNKACRGVKNRDTVAEFNYKTNITDETEQKMVETEVEEDQFYRESRENASTFDAVWDNLTEDTQRQLTLVKHIGTAALPVNQSKELNHAVTEMEGIYGTAQVWLKKNNTYYDLEPGLTRIMATSRNYDELLEVWKGWRDATGPKMKDTYTHFVNLSNSAVQSIGYSDTGDEWLSYYESDTFEEELLALFEQIRPLYEHLHAYVRRRLIKKYGPEKFPQSGHIPAHLLGDMWAQHWDNILDLVLPFPDKPSMDVTQEMVNQNYNASHMFRTAENFFVSLGLKPMTDIFWEKSMIEKPTDGRTVMCHGSAFDMDDKNGQDFRIKMCTDITHEDLKTVHHEMGHIQYYMQYNSQPMVYHGGANPGFHEAVGDLMALSFDTPEHLKKIGLLDKVPTDDETDINFLMKMALEKVAFLPFGYLIDLWRFSVFRGITTPETYNTDWWNVRCRYQGISPPVPRTEEDFDPGAKYHVPSNVEYTRYFVSFIIQFQFYKAACEAAGYNGTLHRCDFYNSTEAGTRIGDMLKMGLSRPWPDAMEKITGQRKMDAGPLLEYFKPLLDYLQEQNGNDYGWRPMCPTNEELNAEVRPEDARDTGESIHCSLLILWVLPLLRLLF